MADTNNDEVPEPESATASAADSEDSYLRPQARRCCSGLALPYEPKICTRKHSMELRFSTALEIDVFNLLGSALKKDMSDSNVSGQHILCRALQL